MFTNRGRDRPLVGAMRCMATVAVAAMIALPAACGTATKAAPLSGLKYTDTVARAGLVYVQVQWHGWLVLSKDVSTLPGEYLPKGVYGPYSAVTACSGFVASPSGDVVTAGHCVDAENLYGGKGAILSAAASQITNPQGKHFTPSQRSRWMQAIDANASIEGLEAGSPVDRTVTVAVPEGPARHYKANVVDVQPFTQGDVALLRAVGILAPALPLARSTPAAGDSVVAAGYPGAVAELVDSSTPASFIEGTVSGTQTVNGTPFTQISSQTSPGMSGGPVLNLAGQVVGTVSWSPTGTTAANFMTDLGSIRSVLASNGVALKLTPPDQAFRQGVAYYYARRYHDAATAFGQVLAVRSGQRVARQYQQLSVARYAQDVNPPGGGTPWGLYGGIGGAVVVVLLGAAGVLLLRRRARPSPSGVGASTGTEPPTAPATTFSYGATGSVPPRGAVVEPPPLAPHEPVAPSAQPAEAPRADAGPREPEGHVFCPNCGTRHMSDAHYCENCGQPFISLPVSHGGDEARPL